MKKYVYLSIITCLFLSCAWLAPKYIENSVPKVQIAEWDYVEYTETVKAEGTVEESEKTDLFLDIPVVPDEVYVEVGDHVEIGDVLATVDSEQTVNAIANNQSKLSSSVSGKLDDAVEEIPQTLTSKASGIVTSLSLVKGSLTPTGGSVVTISNLSSLRVKASVSEDDISKVQVNQTVTITGTAFDGKFKGTVKRIYPSASTKTDGLSSESVVNVLISLAEYDEDFRPGYHVTAKITVAEEREVAMLPYSCVGQLDDGREYVFCYENGRAVMKEVVTGMERSDGVEIVSGLNEYDIVLTPASELTQNNCYVKIIEE